MLLSPSSTQDCTSVYLLTHTCLKNNRKRITSEVNRFWSEPYVVRKCSKGLKNLEYFFALLYNNILLTS